MACIENHQYRFEEAFNECFYMPTSTRGDPARCSSRYSHSMVAGGLLEMS